MIANRLIKQASDQRRMPNYLMVQNSEVNWKNLFMFGKPSVQNTSDNQNK